MGFAHESLAEQGDAKFWFRVQGSGFKVQGSRFEIQGSGFRVLNVER
jgi:hypothetical protein